jgi:hypothetical protein
MKNDKELLREYVRAFLHEESDGGGFTGAGGGVAQASTTGVVGMRDALLHPFKVLIGKSKELGASLKNLGKISLSAVASIATLGIYKPDYDKLNSAYENEIKNIQQAYGPLYAQTRQVLSRGGVTFAAFLYNPTAYLTINHPGVVLRTALAVTGAGGVASALGLSATSGLGIALAGFAAGQSISKENAEKLRNLAKSKIDKLVPKESAAALGKDYRSSVDSFFSDAKGKLKKLQNAKSINDLPIDEKQKAGLENELKSSEDKENFLKIAKQNIAKKQIMDLIQHRNNLLGTSEAAKSSDLYKRYTAEMNEIAKMFGVSSN